MRKSYQFDIDKYRLTNTFPISVLPGCSGPSISKFFSDFRNKISVLAKFLFKNILSMNDFKVSIRVNQIAYNLTKHKTEIKVTTKTITKMINDNKLIIFLRKK